MSGKQGKNSNTVEKSRTPSFDKQAGKYDRRAGLSETVCRQVARQVLEMAEVRSGDRVVEVGAGTGQIGQWFAIEPVQYLGFDLSEGMLEKFRQRLSHTGDNCDLLVADGNQQWPIASGTARAIFSSRALHLLRAEHVVDEVFRVAQSDGAVLIVGGIQRQQESVPARMKQQMHQLLRKHGFQPRQKDRQSSQLVKLCCGRGAKMIESVVVARWQVSRTPQQSLDSWHSKPGLAGIDLPGSVQEEILSELKAWAGATFGELLRPVESEEGYVLEGVRLQ